MGPCRLVQFSVAVNSSTCLRQLCRTNLDRFLLPFQVRIMYCPRLCRTMLTLIVWVGSLIYRNAVKNVKSVSMRLSISTGRHLFGVQPVTDLKSHLCTVLTKQPSIVNIVDYDL